MRLRCASATIAFLLIFGGFLPARAEWKLVSSERIGAAALPITHVRKVVANDREAELHVVLIDPKKCALAVIDHPPGSGGDLASTMRRHGCLAGVNGSYFHPDGTPLGLVIADGKLIHPLEKARLLSGLIVVTDNRVSLLRIAEFNANPEVKQALQAGPFLIDR